MPTDGWSELSQDAVLRVIGATDLLPSEVSSPSADPWSRALALAEAKGRVLAASLGAELGRDRDSLLRFQESEWFVTKFLFAAGIRSRNDDAGDSELAEAAHRGEPAADENERRRVRLNRLRTRRLMERESERLHMWERAELFGSTSD